jgi:kynurenine formamidase
MNQSLAEQLRTAQVYDLEQPRFAGMPIFPDHRPGYFYALYRRHRDNYRPETNGPRSGSSGVLTMMEHSGTHLDALCHQACDLTLHGGITVADAETQTGYTRLAVEEVPPILGPAALLDVAGWKGQDRLPEGYGVTADDLRACAATQGVPVHNGDVLLVRTGFGACWQDEGQYLRAAGVARSGSQWAADCGVVAVGADNMTWDLPEERDPETGATLFGHLHLLVRHGIYILENLNLEQLARDRCYRFAFIGVPLKFCGATGSPLRPLALVSRESRAPPPGE